MLLEVKGLTVGYGSPVVKEVSFQVRQGEIVGLLGRNGSGKTTLLRGLMGGAKVTGGQARLSGQDLFTLSPRARARKLSLLPQHTQRLPGLRVWELIAMGRYPHSGVLGGFGGKEREAVRQAARRFGLEDLLRADCAKLSQGQRQLAYLARVVVQAAPVLLLDEPNSALDFANAHQLFTQVRRLVREEGRGALVVLHDPALALAWCDRLYRIEEGRLSPPLSVAGAGEEEIQGFLQALYPTLQVKKMEDGSFFCRLA